MGHFKQKQVSAGIWQKAASLSCHSTSLPGGECISPFARGGRWAMRNALMPRAFTCRPSWKGIWSGSPSTRVSLPNGISIGSSAWPTHRHTHHRPRTGTLAGSYARRAGDRCLLQFESEGNVVQTLKRAGAFYWYELDLVYYQLGLNVWLAVKFTHLFVTGDQIRVNY